jgi:two-component system OmpR family sensor kinase
MRVRIVAAVVVLLAASAAVSIVVLRGTLLDRLDEEITLNLGREVEEFELLVGGIDPLTGEPFDSVKPVFDIYFAREVPDEGETLLAFLDGDLYLDRRADNAVPAEELDDAIDYWLELESHESGSLTSAAGETRYEAFPFTVGTGEGLFVAANFPADERAEITGAVRAQAITQFVTIVIASLIGLALAGRVLRPLRSLADTARTISETDLTKRIPVHGHDEASRIATAFNDMLGRLESSFATQRQFLDDASHELRVPLTVVRGNVEILELEKDPIERAAMIAVVTDEIERMSRIVEDLLLLARSERPGFLSVEQIDLAELTTDIFRKASVLCNRNWSLDEAAPAVIHADAQRLTQAMMQLAQNACQHTEEHTTVRIGSRVSGGDVTLWVHDAGRGVPAEEAESIFRRYVRGSDRPAGSGLGLGLSIVAAIASAHGGNACVVQGFGGGGRFEITLPGAVVERPVASKAEPSQ